MFCLAILVRNDATFFCNIIMFFHKLQYYFVSYHVMCLIMLFCIITMLFVCLVMLVCNDIILISMYGETLLYCKYFALPILYSRNSSLTML